MTKRFIFAAVMLGMVFGGVIGFKLFKQAAIRDYLDNMGTPPIHVTGTKVLSETWEQWLSAIGSLRALQGITIRSEVDGVIRKIHVDSNAKVKAGDLLVELDDVVDRATLKSATVRLDKTKRDFDRDRSLFERGLVSQDKFEISRSDYESAQALVEHTQGIIDKKTVRAPFDGTIGIHNLAEGQYLELADDVMSIQALNTLYLDLNFPENELERVRPGQKVNFSVPSHGDRVFTGQVRYVDISIQPATRNLLVRAVVDNSTGELLPGMFASASLVLEDAQEVVVVPREAVAYSLYGETVYLLEQTSQGWKTRSMAVTTGEVRDDLVVVKGLAAGQIIARDTQHRLLEGSPVVVENLTTLLNSAPSPVESD